MNIGSKANCKAGVWVSPAEERPPNDEHILVHTTSDLKFLAFRKSNDYFCCAPLPDGIASVKLEEFEIKFWMIPLDAPQ